MFCSDRGQRAVDIISNFCSMYPQLATRMGGNTRNTLFNLPGSNVAKLKVVASRTVVSVEFCPSEAY